MTCHLPARETKMTYRKTDLPTDRPRILLAEDEPAVRRSLQLLLQGRGYEVRSYASGRAAAADPKAFEADCFVSDYRISDMDGLAILRELRARDWNGPAILITAFHSSALEERAIRGGFDCVLSKPLSDHVLTDAIARLLTQAPARPGRA
jgi:CheY-like chemotaxis protein